jgi:antitoxin component YwqK of YwqJK toxin-antitoxin module
MRIDFDDADWDDNAHLTYEGTPFTGEVVEKHPNGRVIAVTSYLDGREDGPSEEWYPSGELKARGSAKDGNAIGLHQEWYRNGRLSSEVQFDINGRQLAKRTWDEDGILTDEKIYSQ